MRVACAVEGEAYLRHSAAMLHSVQLHNPGIPVQIDYLHGGDTSARSRSRLANMVMALGGEITFHEVADHWVAGLPVKGFTRKATWYRVFLEELIPDAARILYLDVDLLVMDSLQPLWEAPLDGYLLGAVTNVPPLHEKAYTERPQLQGDPYFNAGVLLMDLGAFRQEGVGEQLRAFSVRNASRLRWRDQDALNEVLHDRRLPLHPRWNCMNALLNFPWAEDYFDIGELEEARHHPAIRHFEGPSYNKPWHLLCPAEVHTDYVEHRRQTPWPRVRRTGCTPANLLRYMRRRFA